jgi:hypothetical protein
LASQALENLRQQQGSSLAYFDTFWMIAVLTFVVSFAVLFMKRSVSKAVTSLPNEVYPPPACDRLASLRMLLSVASMCGIRELLKQPTDRADEAEMIQPLTVQPHQAPRPPSSAFRAPPIGCFIPCNSLHERRLQRLARAQLCQDRLRAFGDVEHDRRAGPWPSRRSDWVGSGFPSPIARRETGVLPNAQWGEGLG